MIFPSSCAFSSYRVWLCLPSQRGTTHFAICSYFVCWVGFLCLCLQPILKIQSMNLRHGTMGNITVICSIYLIKIQTLSAILSLNSWWTFAIKNVEVIFALCFTQSFFFFWLHPHSGICNRHMGSGSTHCESTMQTNVSQRSQRKSSPLDQVWKQQNQRTHCMSSSYGGNNCQ